MTFTFALLCKIHTCLLATLAICASSPFERDNPFFYVMLKACFWAWPQKPAEKRIGLLFEDTLVGVCLENLSVVVCLSISNCVYVGLLWVLHRSSGLMEALGGHWITWLECPLWCWELNLCPLQEQHVPAIPEPSPRLSVSVFIVLPVFSKSGDNGTEYRLLIIHTSWGENTAKHGTSGEGEVWVVDRAGSGILAASKFVWKRRQKL